MACTSTLKSVSVLSSVSRNAVHRRDYVVPRSVNLHVLKFQGPPTPPPNRSNTALLNVHTALNRLQKRWPTFIGIGVVVLTGWAAFLTYVTNETKVTSSVVKQILRTVKTDPQLLETLGLAIRPQPEWWLNGYPVIHGQINQLQGNIDVSFRIKGSRSSGTVYFTSVRKAKGIPYEILRFRVIHDDGQVVEVQTAPDLTESD